jgi:ribosomal-protein-serine acetyltransferase
MTRLLPERLLGRDQLLLRRWVPDDANLVRRAVEESLEHLRPWMPWVSEEPLSDQERRTMIREWEREWLRGGDVYMGVFLGGLVAGGCGLHHRIGPGALEIGYWTHPAFLRRGVATGAAGLLTDAAFGLPGITHVEIHHDKANQASSGVPRKLGYQLVGEAQEESVAPAEVGISYLWRMTRDEWERRKKLMPT